ncbi:MAG TPA: carboxypeptidase regulatory-like domain-containing protein [Pyrinomonadaceae bacterium]|nr:carboxypeptidase regulatory-like domain-containing protein [Pyrinomonadaceae bacterium]
MANAQVQAVKLAIRVLDETGVAVADARIVLEQSATQTLVRGETDAAGRHEFDIANVGSYQVKIEKEGFYASTRDVRVGETSSLEITIYHQQEIAETVNVYDSPPAIDPDKTANGEAVTSREILTVPYPSTRDYRKALPLIPGVLADASDQIHLGGSATYQVFDQLDDFNIRDPVTGLLKMRISPDALRVIEAQSSRSSAQYGKGSGGTLSLTSSMGDDRYRFSATNFIPSPQNRKGLHFNEWTPRATFSGPLLKKKAWFFDGVGGTYTLTIVPELPDGADRAISWRVDNLLKAQVNLTERNILTASFLSNNFHSGNNGLSRFEPQETTANLDGHAYLATVKDQFYAFNGALFEIGFAVNQFHDTEEPKGSLPYQVSPEGVSGNFFRTSNATARRYQWIANLTLPLARWAGTHEIKFGTDLDQITDEQSAIRNPIFIVREDRTLSRLSMFVGGASFSRRNFESSIYGQDRWSTSKRLLLELGLRADRDTIIRRTSVSPRVAATYLVTRDGSMKLSSGIGLYHDATNLDLITRPLAGQRLDQFYASNGITPLGPPLITSFQVNEQGLRVPRYLNWSVELENKLPAQIYLDAEFLQKRGKNILAYFEANSGFELLNDRQDRYDAFQLTLRRAFKRNYAVLAAYTRSRAHSNAVLENNIDDPVFGPQAGGPLPWDAPNHFISWGWMPLVKKFDFVYSLDWRSGFPFSAVDQQQRLVGDLNSRRFPDYFTLNTHLERRFTLFSYILALRAGFNNVTNRQNPTVVNNNIDSPQFLTFGGTEHRVLTGRIRFIGRK